MPPNDPLNSLIHPTILFYAHGFGCSDWQFIQHYLLLILTQNQLFIYSHLPYFQACNDQHSFAAAVINFIHSSSTIKSFFSLHKIIHFFTLTIQACNDWILVTNQHLSIHSTIFSGLKWIVSNQLPPLHSSELHTQSIHLFFFPNTHDAFRLVMWVPTHCFGSSNQR